MDEKNQNTEEEIVEAAGNASHSEEDSLTVDALADLKEVAEVTQLPGWQRIYHDMLTEREIARQALETSAPGDVKTHQAMIAAVNGFIGSIAAPVHKMLQMREKFPLFESVQTVHGQFDEKTGIVTIKDDNLAEGDGE